MTQKHVSDNQAWLRRTFEALSSGLDLSPAGDDHPSSEDLARLAEGELGAEDAGRVRSHLVWCDDCAAAYFSLLDAVLCERFWNGLRKELRGAGGREVTPGESPTRRLVHAKVRRGEKQETSVRLRIEEGPSLPDGEFRVRLGVPDQSSIRQASAEITLHLGNEVVVWEEELSDGILDCRRDFGPIPHDLSSPSDLIGLDTLLLRSLDLEILLDTKASSLSCPHPLETVEHISYERRAKQAWKARWHACRASEGWDTELAGIDVAGITTQLWTFETNTRGMNWLHETFRMSRSRDKLTRQQFEGRIDQWYDDIQDTPMKANLESLRDAYVTRRLQAAQTAIACPRYASDEQQMYYLLDDAGILVVGTTAGKSCFRIYTGFRPTNMHQENPYPSSTDYRRQAEEYLQNKGITDWHCKDHWDIRHVCS